MYPNIFEISKHRNKSLVVKKSQASVYFKPSTKEHAQKRNTHLKITQLIQLKPSFWWVNWKVKSFAFSLVIFKISKIKSLSQ